MKIEIVGDKPAPGAGMKVLAGRIGKKPAASGRPQTQRSPRAAGRAGGRQGGGRGARGGAAGAKRAPPRKTPTKEQLDAELDAYVSKMDTA